MAVADPGWDDAGDVPYADLDGLSLYADFAGKGEPELVFVPGWYCDHSAFRPQFDHFAHSRAVTALDPRGCGQSDRPDGGYTIPELADDLARFCAAVGIARLVVVGHSLGGIVAVELAARHPSPPAGLVLVDPGPIDPPPTSSRFFETFLGTWKARTARTCAVSTSAAWGRATRRSPAGARRPCARRRSRSRPR